MRPLDYESNAGGRPSPLRELLGLAGPTIAQMASYTLMQFIDTWLLSRYGANRATAVEPTAASNGGMFAFALISVGFGTLTVVNTLVSQSFGRGDRRACGQYLWQGIWFSIIYFMLMLPVLPWARAIFLAFKHEAQLAEGEATYLRIMIFGAGVKLIGVALGQFLLAIDRPMAVLTATLCGVSVNALAAWVMIYGKLGIPAMGIRGSAWGQQVGVLIEMLVLVALALRTDVRRTYFLGDWRPRAQKFMTLLKVGVPAGGQLVADVLAWSLFSVWVMAPLGTDAMAANTFTFRFYSVSFMPAYGLSVAVTALVGRYIGRGQPDTAVQRARLGFLLAAAYMAACGVGFFIGRRVLLELFTDNPTVLGAGAVMLVYAAVYQFFDAMYIVYLGALRGAGDTLVPAVATGVLCWSVTVAGGRAIAVWAPRLGPAGPWAAAMAYGIVLGAFIYGRFARGGWRRIRLEAVAPSS
jgi:MATE family multidrug resistance protein